MDVFYNISHIRRPWKTSIKATETIRKWPDSDTQARNQAKMRFSLKFTALIVTLVSVRAASTESEVCLAKRYISTILIPCSLLPTWSLMTKCPIGLQTLRPSLLSLASPWTRSRLVLHRILRLHTALIVLPIFVAEHVLFTPAELLVLLHLIPIVSLQQTMLDSATGEDVEAAAINWRPVALPSTTDSVIRLVLLPLQLALPEAWSLSPAPI